ncbi:tRNA (guanosine(37)-N1)-methyltransferase TrmD [Patescibacteria group bacterium]|nr:tRNA (guanosine(37)-N1)-methyltransferase TrmD [Patescibacteria group bacterium]MDE1946777.1 tRNA (guanosine(37)-N1)-methyltransferase TrmD [Patescibacteria group bacterium]MDE2011091.1 tRNA (guanosine(37)-N1)-methyltransferase TrmD [Patescibacteria group bacterium]MDE2233148.1 tRNA (guanosine(37)-N1)-methyltransferase TrmD [Patescibacteria group bacterium]
MHFHIVALFPESFESYLDASIIKRARKNSHISIKYYNPRDFVVPKKSSKQLTYADRRVDDRPYGGGPGMVIEALPVARAIEKAIEGIKKRKAKNKRSQIRPKIKIIFFSPAGEQFTNKAADAWKKYSDIILVCGRYEGIDARVNKMFKMAEVSVGPYTLTGGELPAMIVIDAVARRIEGVLGDDMSVEERRVAGHEVYTRPEEVKFKGKRYRVPKILISGHHAKINDWKMKFTEIRHR